MKKPHEQEWKQGSNDKFTVRDADGRLVACVYTDDMDREEADAIGQTIAAAPDMTRALLALTEADVAIPANLLRDVFAALKKAGVL